MDIRDSEHWQSEDYVQRIDRQQLKKNVIN